jgi:hypothetical protein
MECSRRHSRSVRTRARRSRSTGSVWRNIPGPLPRQAEHALGGDVALDLADPLTAVARVRDLCGSWYFPKGITEPEVPSGDRLNDKWAREKGGLWNSTDETGNDFEITVEGAKDSAIVLNGMRDS